MTRLLFLALCLCSCARSSTIEIGPQKEPIEIGNNGVFINSSLLGLEGRTITIDTASNNDVEVRVSGESPAEASTRTKAF